MVGICLYNIIMPVMLYSTLCVAKKRMFFFCVWFGKSLGLKYNALKQVLVIDFVEIDLPEKII